MLNELLLEPGTVLGAWVPESLSEDSRQRALPVWDLHSSLGRQNQQNKQVKHTEHIGLYYQLCKKDKLEKIKEPG